MKCFFSKRLAGGQHFFLHIRYFIFTPSHRGDRATPQAEEDAKADDSDEDGHRVIR